MCFKNEYTSVSDVCVSVFFLLSGTFVSLRALNAAFICIVPLILVDSAVSAIECMFDVPRSTLTLCENAADGLTRQRNWAAPRTVMPDSTPPAAFSPWK